MQILNTIASLQKQPDPGVSFILKAYLIFLWAGNLGDWALLYTKSLSVSISFGFPYEL